ncbi:MAG: class I SAM-dependent methyltransferase [Nitrospiraceae bacterium]
MRRECLETFVFSDSGNRLIVDHIEVEAGGEIREGLLVEHSGKRSVPIKNFVPRFVGEHSYADSFGLQWNRHRRTQIDRYNGTTISADRFYANTGWSVEELHGQRILEVGCGAGRFTQVMLDAGAEVYALDYSTAVEACWVNNGPHPRLCVIQADIYSMPFKRNYFDKVFCFGVLQHTPDVKRAFMSLPPFVKTGGKLAVDVYVKSRWPTRWTSKYLWRPITKRMSHEWLFRIIEWYVPHWLPFDNWVQQLPRLGQYVIGTIPCWNYTGTLPLTQEQINEWAILDTFDALAPRYDNPQTITDVRAWFEEAKLLGIDVHYGSNGIVGTAYT